MACRVANEPSVNLQPHSGVRVQHRHELSDTLSGQRDQRAPLLHDEIRAQLLRLLGAAVS